MLVQDCAWADMGSASGSEIGAVNLFRHNDFALRPCWVYLYLVNEFVYIIKSSAGRFEVALSVSPKALIPVEPILFW